MTVEKPALAAHRAASLGTAMAVLAIVLTFTQRPGAPVLVLPLALAVHAGLVAGLGAVGGGVAVFAAAAAARGGFPRWGGLAGGFVLIAGLCSGCLGALTLFGTSTTRTAVRGDHTTLVYSNEDSPIAAHYRCRYWLCREQAPDVAPDAAPPSAVR